MIYECLPYFNEELISRIRIKNDLGFINQIHIVESDYTFKYSYKGYNFPKELQNINSVNYFKLNGKKKFVPNNFLGKIELINYRISEDEYKKGLSSPAWYNESVQRNFVSDTIHPNDDDYVILCDIDEILDMRCLPLILEEVDKRGIVTCKLRFTMFYFNLFVNGWGGPDDYSYRMFIMTGKYFKNLQCSSDELRKKGERNQLLDYVYCLPEYCGFHHSWLGDTKAVLNKINAYAHSTSDHKGTSEDYITKCIQNGEAIFEGIELFLDDSVSLLQEVESLRETHPHLFWKKG